MRYNRLADLGLSEQQIRDNLMFVGEKVGETMTIPVKKADQTQWFGVPPPDLSVIARSRGPDWLYTYLRSYYRDSQTATGWNNVVFPNAAMPHVLWQLQGVQEAVWDGQVDAQGNAQKHFKEFKLVTPGSLSPEEYDTFVRDTVNFLDYIAEPAQLKRRSLGFPVIALLVFFTLVAWLPKKEYWKDVK